MVCALADHSQIKIPCVSIFVCLGGHCYVFLITFIWQYHSEVICLAGGECEIVYGRVNQYGVSYSVHIPRECDLSPI